MMLRAPSPLTMKRPESFSVSPPGLTTVAVTPSASCANAVKLVDSRRSMSGCALASFIASSTILIRSHCRTYGKRRVVLEMLVVELGDQLALVTVPVMEQRRDDAARLQQLVEADALEQLQRRRMIGAGARHLLEEIVVVERLDQRDLHALLRQRERQAEPDRPCPDDDHALRRLVRHWF